MERKSRALAIHFADACLLAGPRTPFADYTGALAHVLRHPLGASGVRPALTLARELKRAGLRYGIASDCIGGGIENPTAIHRPQPRI